MVTPRLRRFTGMLRERARSGKPVADPTVYTVA
jgi:hypothetical protein